MGGGQKTPIKNLHPASCLVLNPPAGEIPLSIFLSGSFTLYSILIGRR